MKATAVAPSNIALIKYWGKIDEELRLPANASVSMNLDNLITITTVEFSHKYKTDTIHFLRSSKFIKKTLEREFNESEKNRIIRHLERIRVMAHIQDKAAVATSNNFPKGSGIASSASGFAALTVAGCVAAGLAISERELTILARLGSGSACRSIPDGFAMWQRGKTSEESFAYSLFPASHWELRDILCIVDAKPKKTLSTDGMRHASASSLWGIRQLELPKRICLIKQALKEKNITLLGNIIEKDCLDMHSVMQTQTPPLFYWNDDTKRIINSVIDWRRRGLPVYFTIDAGPNVHLICESISEKEVTEKAKTLSGVQQILINKPSSGAHLIHSHLF